MVGLQKNGQVVLKVTCLLRGEKKGDEPSVMMKSDVLEIAQRQKERLLNLRGEVSFFISFQTSSLVLC